MNKTENTNLPLGYWIKQVDQLLTKQIDAAQAVNGVTRTEWQVLNLLSEVQSMPRDALLKQIEIFSDAASLDKIIASLFDRGWIALVAATEQDEQALSLTEDGKQQHAKILATQKEFRQRAVQGITKNEYETVVGVLRQMVANLEKESPAAEGED